jgi:hypothetical protein
VQPDGGKCIDGWPSEWHRLVGMRVSLLTVAVRVGLSGALLVALPDISAAEYVQKGDLRRLPVELPARDVYAVTALAASKRASVAEIVRRVRKRMNNSPSSEERSLPRGLPLAAASS